MSGDPELTAALTDCTLDEYSMFHNYYTEIKGARGDVTRLVGMRDLIVESNCLTDVMKIYLLRMLPHDS